MAGFTFRKMTAANATTATMYEAMLEKLFFVIKSMAAGKRRMTKIGFATSSMDFTLGSLSVRMNTYMMMPHRIRYPTSPCHRRCLMAQTFSKGFLRVSSRLPRIPRGTRNCIGPAVQIHIWNCGQVHRARWVPHRYGNLPAAMHPIGST